MSSLEARRGALSTFICLSLEPSRSDVCKARQCNSLWEPLAAFTTVNFVVMHKTMCLYGTLAELYCCWDRLCSSPCRTINIAFCCSTFIFTDRARNNKKCKFVIVYVKYFVYKLSSRTLMAIEIGISFLIINIFIKYYTSLIITYIKLVDDSYSFHKFNVGLNELRNKTDVVKCWCGMSLLTWLDDWLKSNYQINTANHNIHSGKVYVIKNGINYGRYRKEYFVLMQHFAC